MSDMEQHILLVLVVTTKNKIENHFNSFNLLNTQPLIQPDLVCEIRLTFNL